MSYDSDPMMSSMSGWDEVDFSQNQNLATMSYHHDFLSSSPPSLPIPTPSASVPPTASIFLSSSTDHRQLATDSEARAYRNVLDRHNRHEGTNHSAPSVNRRPIAAGTDTTLTQANTRRPTLVPQSQQHKLILPQLQYGTLMKQLHDNIADTRNELHQHIQSHPNTERYEARLLAFENRMNLLQGDLAKISTMVDNVYDWINRQQQTEAQVVKHFGNNVQNGGTIENGGGINGS